MDREITLTLRQGSGVVTLKLEDDVPDALDLMRKLIIGMDLAGKPFAASLEVNPDANDEN